MHKVLFVDDDTYILSAYRRAFRKNEKFELHTAEGAKEGIEKLKHYGPFSVVISDQKMPQIQGTAFLASVRTHRPDAVRMMLTGNADQETAVDAVNKGAVFRFLTKPCSPEELSSAIDAAIRQYELENGERELLEETLTGSVKVLVDIISLRDEQLSGRMERMRGWAREFGQAGWVKKAWELNMAVLLSPIGEATLPPDIAAKKTAGEKLNVDEASAVEHAPEAGAKLIANIPRLASIGEAVRYQNKGFDGSGFPDDDVAGKSIPQNARILKILKDLARAADSDDIAGAFAEISKEAHLYDPDLLGFVNDKIVFAAANGVIAKKSAG